MKKLLLISNPSVLGKNLENILKQNYHTDFISTVPKQIGSIPFNSYNALLLDFTLLHEYSLIICKTAKKHFPNIIVLFLCATNIPVLMATLDGNTKTLLPVSELPCILSLIQ